MLINARILANEPTWKICPKKKKNPGTNQCGEKGGGGGVLHTLWICGFEQFRTKKLKIKFRVFEN